MQRLLRPQTEADCIVQAESRVAPAQELADHHLVNPSLAEEQAEGDWHARHYSASFAPWTTFGGSLVVDTG
jgi:hypothetical protein